MQEVVRLIPSQVKQVATVLCRAFYDDPLVQYMIPSEARRTQVLPSLHKCQQEYIVQKAVFPLHCMSNCLLMGHQ